MTYRSVRCRHCACMVHVCTDGTLATHTDGYRGWERCKGSRQPVDGNVMQLPGKHPIPQLGAV